jgi:hypothetical protein
MYAGDCGEEFVKKVIGGDMIRFKASSSMSVGWIGLEGRFFGGFVFVFF